MFFIFYIALMIAVFILVLCFCLEVLKRSAFTQRAKIVISLCVALFSTISLFTFPIPVTTKHSGLLSIILLPYQALGIFVLLLVLVGLVYRFMGEKRRQELNAKIRNLFESFGR